MPEAVILNYELDSRMLDRFRGWLFRRFRNFMLFSVVAFGSPIYFLLTLVRAGEVEGWARLGDVFFGAVSGVLWGLGMWVFAKPRVAEPKDHRGKAEP